MILFLNTTDLNNIQFSLIDKEKFFTNTTTVPYHENFKTLSLLKKFLRKSKVDKPSKIVVASGPGSFTGIRVGISLAQGLGFGWQIPVVAIPNTKIPKDIHKLATLKAGKTLSIEYGRPAV